MGVLVVIAVVGVARAKAKRTGIDPDHIDRFIEDARRRSYDRARHN